MSTNQPKYQFVFNHLGRIDEVPGGSLAGNSVNLHRNESSHNFHIDPAISSLTESLSMSKSLSTPNFRLPTQIANHLNYKER